MKHDGWKQSGPEEARESPGGQQAARPAPGKVTLTSKLPAGREPAVQRQPAATAAATAPGRSSWDQTMDPWMDAAHRGLPVQMQQTDSAPSGRAEHLPFGDYWVVPDDANQCYADAIGEQITETELAALQDLWNRIGNGSGAITVVERDDTSVDHAGFRARILACIGRLMSEPAGRGLIRDLMSGGQPVTIRPSSATIYGGANAIRTSSGTLERADGSAGAGGGTIIQIDPNVGDNDIKVNDAHGNQISDPVFIFLGHEMIHAHNNQRGRNRRNLAATDGAYSNREEQQTVATGALTENQLRAEHGLTARHGSGGVDTRSP